MDDYLWDLKNETMKLMKIRGYDDNEEDDFFRQPKSEDLYHQIDVLYKEPDLIRDFLRLNKITSVRSGMTTFYNHPDGRTCLVYFADNSPKFLTREANIVRDLLIKYPVNICVIVSYHSNGCQPRLDEIEAKTKESQMYSEKKSDALRKFIETELHFDFFEDLDLFYNPLDHVYSPVISKLSRRDIKDLQLERSELPIILSTDPIVKRMGYLPGNILRLVCNNLVSGNLLTTEITYRVVKIPGQRFTKMEKSFVK